MGCRCGERRTALGQGLRAAARGDLAGVRSAAGLVGRTTIEDVEAMARRMVGGDRQTVSANGLKHPPRRRI